MKNSTNNNMNGDYVLQVLSQIEQDWREYLIGVGNNYPPNEEDYRTFFERMTANMECVESLANKMKLSVNQ